MLERIILQLDLINILTNNLSTACNLKMLQPLSTLPLSKKAIKNLNKEGYVFVDDVNNALNDDINKFVNINALKNNLRSPITLSALDHWQAELQYERCSTFSNALDNILDGGFQCGTITEICGPSGSGKTQLCFQIATAVQLSTNDGGLSGKSLYIDTHNTFSMQRIKDMIAEYKVYENMDLHQRFRAMAKNITVVSPDTPEELLTIVKQLKKFIQTSLDSRPVRVIIIDSLAFPIVSLDDSSRKIIYYHEILNELQRLASKYNIAVVIVNELVTQVNKNNEISFESAGGQAVSSRCNKRIMLARIRNSKFAARLLKSSTMPQVATVFNITSQGIRDEPSIKK